MQPPTARLILRMKARAPRSSPHKRKCSRYSIYAREFGSLSSNQIVKFNGSVRSNPEQMAFTPVANSDGRYRNPLPLLDDKFVATHTPTTAVDPNQLLDFRLKQLTPDFRGLLWELEAVDVLARCARGRVGHHATG